jgi:hypothetical protein
MSGPLVNSFIHIYILSVHMTISISQGRNSGGVGRRDTSPVFRDRIFLANCQNQASYGQGQLCSCICLCARWLHPKVQVLYCTTGTVYFIILLKTPFYVYSISDYWLIINNPVSEFPPRLLHANCTLSRAIYILSGGYRSFRWRLSNWEPGAKYMMKLWF